MMLSLDELREALDVPSALQRIEHKLDTLKRQVTAVARKVGQTLATLEEFNTDNIDASIADINQDNADAVALIADLRDQIAAGGLTADEEAALLARITSAEAAIAAAEAGTDELTPEAPPA